MGVRPPSGPTAFSIECHANSPIRIPTGTRMPDHQVPITSPAVNAVSTIMIGNGTGEGDGAARYPPPIAITIPATIRISGTILMEESNPGTTCVGESIESNLSEYLRSREPTISEHLHSRQRNTPPGRLGGHPRRGAESLEPVRQLSERCLVGVGQLGQQAAVGQRGQLERLQLEALVRSVCP